MYFASLSQGLSLPIRDRKVFYVQNGPNVGEIDHINPAVTVQFTPAGGAPEHVLDAISKLPAFGRGIGLNESPFDRIGAFDTVVAQKNEGWDDTTREFVENTLLAGAGTLYVRADYPKANAPWPNYDRVVGDDEVAAETIARKVEEDGYDVSAVLVYEKQNQARQSVIDVLEILNENVTDSALDGTVIQA